MENNSNVNISDQEYLKKVQIARFQDLSSIENQDVFRRAGQTQQGQAIFLFFAKNIPKDKKQQDFMNLYMIKEMNEYTDKEYIIYTFNNGAPSYTCIQTIFQFLKTVPKKYTQNLQKIYIVNPSFWVKCYLLINGKKKLKNKLEYIDDFKKSPNIEEIETYQIPKDILKQLGYDENEQELIQKTKEQQQEKQENINFENMEFDEMEKEDENDSNSMPKALAVLIQYFYKNEEKMKLQGIFRKSGYSTDLDLLEKNLKQQNYDYINDQQNDIDPFVVAGLIKKILHKSKTPLIPFELNNQIAQISEVEVEKQFEYVNQIIEQNLNTQRKNILNTVIAFLADIEKYEEQNKMTSYNLAVCFAPCLLRTEKPGIQDLQYTGVFVRTVQVLIEEKIKQNKQQ